MQDALERTSIENNVPIDRVSCNVWKVQQSIERGTKLHGRGSRPAQPVKFIVNGDDIFRMFKTLALNIDRERRCTATNGVNLGAVGAD